MLPEGEEPIFRFLFPTTAQLLSLSVAPSRQKRYISSITQFSFQTELLRKCLNFPYGFVDWRWSAKQKRERQGGEGRKRYEVSQSAFFLFGHEILSRTDHPMTQMRILVSLSMILSKFCFFLWSSAFLSLIQFAGSVWVLSGWFNSSRVSRA